MTEIVKSFQDMKPFYRKMQPLQTRNLSRVLNSYVACRVCFKERVLAIKSPVTNTFTFVRCWFCKGTGVMSNRELEEGEKYKH